MATKKKAKTYTNFERDFGVSAEKFNRGADKAFGGSDQKVNHPIDTGRMMGDYGKFYKKNKKKEGKNIEKAWHKAVAAGKRGKKK